MKSAAGVPRALGKDFERSLRVGRLVTWCAFLVAACTSVAPGIDVRDGPTSEDSGGAGAAPDSGVRWCDALAVIQRKCQRCHRDPPENGAPFALLQYDDTQVVDRRGVVRYERMLDAIESDYMPATFLDLDPPVEPLDDVEKRLLLDWLTEGAEPTGGTSCTSSG